MKLRYILLTGVFASLAAITGPALAADELPVMVDVRSAEAYQAGHVQGAVSVPADRIDKGNIPALPDKSRPITVYSDDEHNAWMAARELKSQGYSNVKSIGSYDEIKVDLQ